MNAVGAVKVEHRRRVRSPRQEAEALFKPAGSEQRPVVRLPNVRQTVVASPTETEHQKAFRLVREGRYMEASRLAVRLSQEGKLDGFFIYGGTPQFYSADVWLRNCVKDAANAPSGLVASLTPHIAQILLTKNADNRRFDVKNLADLLQDSATGRWKLNGEPVIVSENGDLNDGQHRSLHVVLSGTPVETLFSFGFARETRDTIDTGKKRTGADRLSMSGIENSVVASAVSTLIFEMKKSRNPTKAETDAYFYENREMIESAIRVAGSNIKGVGPSAAGVAAYYLLVNGVTPEDVREFFQKVRTGDMLTARDPRMVLHKAIFKKDSKVKLSRQNWVRAFAAHYRALKANQKLPEVLFTEELVWPN